MTADVFVKEQLDLLPECYHEKYGKTELQQAVNYYREKLLTNLGEIRIEMYTEEESLEFFNLNIRAEEAAVTNKEEIDLALNLYGFGKVFKDIEKTENIQIYVCHSDKISYTVEKENPFNTKLEQDTVVLSFKVIEQVGELFYIKLARRMRLTSKCCVLGIEYYTLDSNASKVLSRYLNNMKLLGDTNDAKENFKYFLKVFHRGS